MNAPELNVHEDSSGRRVCETGGRRYPSVTTILSEAYPKPHLMVGDYWVGAVPFSPSRRPLAISNATSASVKVGLANSDLNRFHV